MFWLYCPFGEDTDGLFPDLVFKSKHAGPCPCGWPYTINTRYADMQHLAMGGDAVINCQFEHRVAVSNTIPGLSVGAQLIPGLANKQVVEIMAYGTVVKLL